MSLELESELEPAPGAALRVYHCVTSVDLMGMANQLREKMLSRTRGTVSCYGKTHTVPRHDMWWGKAAYSFGSRTLAPEKSMAPLIQLCIEWVNATAGQQIYDSALANLYVNGSDYVAEHADNESAMARDVPIWTLVFGPAKRPFQVRGPSVGLVNVPLYHGMAAEMGGTGFQQTCRHGVPRRQKVTEWRLSVTVRKMS